MDKNQKKAEASKNIYDKQTKNVKTKDINLNRKKEEIIIFQFLHKLKYLNVPKYYLMLLPYSELLKLCFSLQMPSILCHFLPLEINCISNQSQ